MTLWSLYPKLQKPTQSGNVLTSAPRWAWPSGTSHASVIPPRLSLESARMDTVITYMPPAVPHQMWSQMDQAVRSCFSAFTLRLRLERGLNRTEQLLIYYSYHHAVPRQTSDTAQMTTGSSGKPAAAAQRPSALLLIITARAMVSCQTRQHHASPPEASSSVVQHGRMAVDIFRCSSCRSTGESAKPFIHLSEYSYGKRDRFLYWRCR